MVRICHCLQSNNESVIAHLSATDQGGPSVNVTIHYWSENGIISWTEWNILIDFCVNIDIIEI